MVSVVSSSQVQPQQGIPRANLGRTPTCLGLRQEEALAPGRKVSWGSELC